MTASEGEVNGNVGPASPEELVDGVMGSTEDDARIDALVKENLGLVYDIANRMRRTSRSGPEHGDLVSAGVSGLIQAARAYDPERGLAFSTLAVTRIRGAILDEIRVWDDRPRSVRKKERELRAAEAALRAKHGRRPTPGELAEALDIGTEELHSWYLDLRQHDAEPAGREAGGADGGGYASPVDRIPYEGKSPLDAAQDQELVKLLTERLLGLPDRERQVLALSYFENMKLREIGEVLGITESRVSQIRTSALGKLRQAMQEVGGAA